MLRTGHRHDQGMSVGLTSTPEKPGQEALLGMVVHELQPLVGAHVLHHGIEDRRAGAHEHKAAPVCRQTFISNRGPLVNKLPAGR